LKATVKMTEQSKFVNEEMTRGRGRFFSVFLKFVAKKEELNK